MKIIKLTLIFLLINLISFAQPDIEDFFGGSGSTKKVSEYGSIVSGEKRVKENDEVDKMFAKVMEGERVLLIADWTGSMYNYTPAVLNYFSRHEGGVKYLAFFNDGDSKPDGPVGASYGIHYANPRDSEGVAEETKRAGGGGSGPENDVEAIWRSVEHFSKGKKWESYRGKVLENKDSKRRTIEGSKRSSEKIRIILVADGSSNVRDMSELYKVKYPVNVVFCKKGGIYVSDYLEIAYQTGGKVVSESSTADFTSSKRTSVSFNGKTYKRNSSGTWF